METNQKLDEIGIGTKETIKLQPADVTVLGVTIKEITSKEDKTKVVGRKVVLLCKHPKKEEPIEISEIEYVKDTGKTKNIKTTTLWVNLDEDQKLQKDSAPVVLLNFAGCPVLKDLTGKTLPTTLDAAGYLCIKAY
jgi:hypothetical protein